MKRFLKAILLIVVAVVVLLAIAVTFLLGGIVKAGIERVGPQLTKTDVSILKVRLSPLAGVVEIRGLVVGNPDGFKTPTAMKVKEFRVDVAMASLFSDTVRVKEILIADPEITFELTMKGNNLAKLGQNAREFSGAGKSQSGKPGDGSPAARRARPRGKAARKVLIDHFLFSGGRVNLSASLLQGQAVPIVLPSVELFDIGKESGGVSGREAMRTILDAVLEAVNRAVAQSGQTPGGAAQALGGAAK